LKPPSASARRGPRPSPPQGARAATSEAGRSTREGATPSAFVRSGQSPVGDESAHLFMGRVVLRLLELKGWKLLRAHRTCSGRSWYFQFISARTSRKLKLRISDHASHGFKPNPAKFRFSLNAYSGTGWKKLIEQLGRLGAEGGGWAACPPARRT